MPSVSNASFSFLATFSLSIECTQLACFAIKLTLLDWIGPIKCQIISLGHAEDFSAEKSSACPKDIIWHFIGPIQSNKVNLIAKHANWVHSIDREKVARKLNDALETEGKKIHALVQVNIDREDSKSGILPEEAVDFTNELNAHYPNLILEGLMFMPKINASKNAKIDTMNKIMDLQKSILSELPSCTHLSLGTSSDFEESILTGSTILRIGESLLGKRS